MGAIKEMILDRPNNMSVIDEQAIFSKEDIFTESQSDYMIVAGSLCLLIASVSVGFTYFVRRCIETVIILTASKKNRETDEDDGDKRKNIAEETI